MNIKPKAYSVGIKKVLSLLFVTFFVFGSSFAQNAIVTENNLPGTDPSVWDNLNGSSGDLSIQGFATSIGVNRGETVNFKVDVNTGADKRFDVTIYRIGYYGGKGARSIQDLGTVNGIAQGACLFDTTGILDCGNWLQSFSWAVPANATSGLYIAKVTRLDGSNGTSHIAFVVRDDASMSKLYFQTSDATWQAYNWYGGNSFYVGPGLSFNHAKKISYNRPFLTRDAGSGPDVGEDWFMNSEYPTIRFLEANGYDMSYTTNVDVARHGNLILNHKVLLSVGHDEYWSKEQRDNVEAARAAGVSLAFFGGNEVYWKTRWENSIDGLDSAYRTIVCYKEGTLPTPQENACGYKCDPTPDWTGLWRDGCNAPGGNACKPENALSSQISWDGGATAIKVPGTYKNLRFWRNCPGIAALTGPTDTAVLAPSTLGYEWDWEQYFDFYPPSRITMSSTNFAGGDGIVHNHKLSMYKTASGAWVFGAGTIQWAWGLDGNHDRNGGGNNVTSIDMQQATINLLADMGAQPATIQIPLVAATASTDVAPPLSVITTPLTGASVPQADTVLISGTASDADGTVAGVEVTTDGGVTWHVAKGTTSWTYFWILPAQGTYTVQSRAFDDSGNTEVPGGGEGGSANSIRVNIVPPLPPTNCPCSIFLPSQAPTAGETNHNDGQGGINLGVKFHAAFNGYVTAIRFYRPSNDNTTNNAVYLYDENGTFRASATFTGSPVAGWTEVPLSTPIAITAFSTYVATYYSPTGAYSSTENTFVDSVVLGPLIGNRDSLNGPEMLRNGVYQYGPQAFPTHDFNATNYWVDVSYTPYTGPDTTAPVITQTSPADGAVNVPNSTYITATFSKVLNSATVNSNTVALRDMSNTIVPVTLNYDASSRTITLVPSLPLNFASSYTVTIKGGTIDPRIKDTLGNAMRADSSWTFTTADKPSIPPDDGSGGPILIISNVINPFSRYTAEILRAQGYNSFKVMDISEVDAADLLHYDVVILGQMSLSGPEITMLSNWTTAGGTLISFRPDPGLTSLLGITPAGGTLADKYLLVNTATGTPGAGIVNQTIQYHGVADLYTLSGATSLATLYSSSNVATTNPAITSNAVGALGGRAIAFLYDLPKSIVYTRQGNPVWAGQSRDGQAGPVRSDDLFYPDWIDFNKIQIPQADEQQHLLTNIILQSNLHIKPLPHLWFLPGGFKAAVVMTGDDHATGNTFGRFNEYYNESASNSAQDVADWKAIRGTSYVYDSTIYMSDGSLITDDTVKFYQDNGFEIALHPTTDCVDFSDASLTAIISGQLATLKGHYASLNNPVTNRTHCLPWSNWAGQAKVENAMGMRFDANYYYWPDAWVQKRAGMFTGSGLPMRFADLDGTTIDTYQGATVITDESGLNITSTIATLLDNATGPKGYYGAFVMNMHTDTAIHTGSDAIIAAAVARSVPVVSAKQMLEWLDSRNNTSFGPMTWLNNDLSFTITTSAHNLQAMVPQFSATGQLIKVTEDGNSIAFDVQTIKGIPYGVFSASSKAYVATYSATPLPVTFLNFTATKQGTSDALLKWTTTMEENNKGFEILRSSDANNWTVVGFVSGAGNSQTQINYQYTDMNLSSGTYYYKLRQVDFDNNSAFSKIAQVTIDGGLMLELLQNRPNPFTSTTIVGMVIPTAGRVQLLLYDQMGRQVQILMDEFKAPGTYQVQVNKNGLGSGIYYYKMNTMNQSLVKKMTVL